MAASYGAYKTSLHGYLTTCSTLTYLGTATLQHEADDIADRSRRALQELSDFTSDIRTTEQAYSNAESSETKEINPMLEWIFRKG